MSTIRTLTIALAVTVAGFGLAGCGSAPADQALAAMRAQATVTVTQPTSVLEDRSAPVAPSTTPRSSNYSFAFSVTQGSDPDEVEARRVVMLDENNDNWGSSGTAQRYVTFAACEFNEESSSVVTQEFNCNIAFSNGNSHSYWVDADREGDFSAELRTH